MSKAQPPTPQFIEAFCAVLAETGIVQRALDALKVSRSEAHAMRTADPGFKTLWDAAMEVATTRFEDEVKRRAFEGVDKPVYQQGIRVGTVREYSDSLAATVLKARIPAYRDKQELKVEGTLSIAQVLAAARKRSRPPVNPEDEV